MVRDESVGELYRQLDPADMLYDYLIGSTIGLFGSGDGMGKNSLPRFEKQPPPPVGHCSVTFYTLFEARAYKNPL